MRDLGKWGFDVKDLGDQRALYTSKDYGDSNVMYMYKVDPAVDLFYISLDQPYKANNIYHKNSKAFRIAYCQEGLYLTNMDQYQIVVSSDSVYAGWSYKTCTYAQTATQTCRAFNMHFYPDKIHLCMDDGLIGTKDIYKRLEETLRQILVNGVQVKTPKIVDLANSLVDALRTMDPILIKLKLYEFLYNLSQEDLAAEDHYQPLVSGEQNQLMDIVEYIEENLDRDLSIQSLCKTFNISKNTLTRRFKKAFSHTPYQYISLARMTKAQGLLASTDLSITQIAQGLGYDNPSNFARRFKDHVGISPSAYRDQDLNK